MITTEDTMKQDSKQPIELCIRVQAVALRANGGEVTANEVVIRQGSDETRFHNPPDLSELPQHVGELSTEKHRACTLQSSCWDCGNDGRIRIIVSGRQKQTTDEEIMWRPVTAEGLVTSRFLTEILRDMRGSIMIPVQDRTNEVTGVVMVHVRLERGDEEVSTDEYLGQRPPYSDASQIEQLQDNELNNEEIDIIEYDESDYQDLSTVSPQMMMDPPFILQGAPQPIYPDSMGSIFPMVGDLMDYSAVNERQVIESRSFPYLISPEEVIQTVSESDASEEPATLRERLADIFHRMGQSLRHEPQTGRHRRPLFSRASIKDESRRPYARITAQKAETALCIARQCAAVLPAFLYYAEQGRLKQEYHTTSEQKQILRSLAQQCVQEWRRWMRDPLPHKAPALPPRKPIIADKYLEENVREALPPRKVILAEIRARGRAMMARHQHRASDPLSGLTFPHFGRWQPTRQAQRKLAQEQEEKLLRLVPGTKNEQKKAKKLAQLAYAAAAAQPSFMQYIEKKKEIVQHQHDILGLWAHAVAGRAMRLQRRIPRQRKEAAALADMAAAVVHEKGFNGKIVEGMNPATVFPSPRQRPRPQVRRPVSEDWLTRNLLFATVSDLQHSPETITKKRNALPDTEKELQGEVDRRKMAESTTKAA